MEGMTFVIDENSPDTIIFEVTNTGDIAVIALAAVAVLSVVGIVFVILRNRKNSRK
ncbi:MAG: LPXTG cell wall anchor domain-containing protein [Clostridia bacterium]|nr:LPXTG cell wall anchor domain-containing protein [Clostridia bacterium]